MRGHTDQSSALLRVAAVYALLVILIAAQIAVLYATLYHFTVAAPGFFPSLVWYPPIWFNAIMVAAAIVVLRRAKRDLWADTPATLTASGLVLLGFATLTTTGLCETGTVVAVSQPLASLSIEWYFTWTVGPATPAIEVSSPGGSCQAFTRAIPSIIAYPLIGGGLWLESWTDEKLVPLVALVESRLPRQWGS